MAELKKNNEATVNVVNGVGNDSIPIPYQDGDTVAAILKKANIELAHGSTVTLGRKRLHRLDTATIKPGDTLVIAGTVSNG